MNTISSTKETPRRRLSRRLRRFAVAIAGTAFSGERVWPSWPAPPERNPTSARWQRGASAYYMAESPVILPDSGYQPSLTEVHQGLAALHQAQMWRSIGRGFGCP